MATKSRFVTSPRGPTLRRFRLAMVLRVTPQLPPRQKLALGRALALSCLHGEATNQATFIRQAPRRGRGR